MTRTQMPNKYLILLVVLLSGYVTARGPGGPGGGWAMGRICQRDCSVDCFSIAPYKCLQGTGKLGGVDFNAIEFVHGKNYQNQWTLAAFNDSQNCNATTAVFAYPLLVATSCLNISLNYNGNQYSYLYIEGPAPQNNNLTSATDELSYTQTGFSNDSFPIVFAVVPLVLIVISLVVVVVAVVKAIKRKKNKQSEEEEAFDLAS